MWFRALSGALFSAILLFGQDAKLVSEFQRYGPDGAPIKSDRVERPVEILSPAVIRGGHLTVRVVVTPAQGAEYSVHVGQNPPDTFPAKLYQEQYTQRGGEWIPDGLLPLPGETVSAKTAEGQRTQSYLLDIAVPRELKPGRYRVEVQVYLDGSWRILPMELRVMTSQVTPLAPGGKLAPVASRADASMLAAVRSWLCGGPNAAGTVVGNPSARALTMRNVREDLEMAKRDVSGNTQTSAAKAAGYGTVNEFCAAKGLPTAGTEWWLRFRKALYAGKTLP
jgi:hypothetical protein